MTGEKLKSKEVTPNFTLRSMISEFKDTFTQKG
jgi:hypothetical protein